jgi:hypothetical protein
MRPDKGKNSSDGDCRVRDLLYHVSVCFCSILRRFFYSTQRNETIISKHAHEHAICAVVHQSKDMEILRKSNTSTILFRCWIGSVIVGSTTMDQLKENLAPFDGNPLELTTTVRMKCQDASCILYEV